jgi:hypothetical protein
MKKKATLWWPTYALWDKQTIVRRFREHEDRS